MGCTVTLQWLQCHQAIGIFHLHYNLRGPLLYMQSITDRNVMWHRTVHSYNGIVFSNKKEHIINTCNDIEESQKYYTGYEKSGKN